MAARVDWDNWRSKFIKGPDDLDLKRLSEYTGAPAYQSLRNRSSAEDWPNQRRRYRDTLGTMAATVPDVQATVAQSQKIIDAAEMLTRHSQVCRLMGQVASHELQLLRRRQQTKDSNGNPVSVLKPAEALQFARAALADERLTEGLATERQEVIDISNLPDSALEKLANGG